MLCVLMVCYDNQGSVSVTPFLNLVAHNEYLLNLFKYLKKVVYSLERYCINVSLQLEELQELKENQISCFDRIGILYPG